MSDPINKPSHYNWHPSRIQPIEISEWCSFNIGTAINYIWRHAHKGEPVQDLRKAAWHLRREAERIAENGPVSQPKGPRDQLHDAQVRATTELIREPFSQNIRKAIDEIWMIGFYDDDEWNMGCLNDAAHACEREAYRLEAVK